jgi:hypothetical protein
MSPVHTRRLATGALVLAAVTAGPPAAAARTDATDPRSPTDPDVARQAELSAGSRSDARSPDARDAALAATARAPGPNPIVVSVSRPRGFAWDDAAIGAGASAGLLLLAAGATGVATRRRNPRPADAGSHPGSR